MISGNIKKDFKSNFLGDENILYCSSNSKNKVSVYEIFEAEKEKARKLAEYNKNLLVKLQSDFSFIQDISFHPLDNFSIVLTFTNGRSSRITLDEEDKLGFIYDTEFSKAEQKFILENYSKELKDLIKFGIKNQYNNITILKTISGRYDLQLTPMRFSIYKPDNFVKITGKRLSLNYFYSQKAPSNAITTDLGIFNVRTNISGIKRILKKTYNSDSNLKMKNLFQHLQVYESDVPEYLKEEIEKVKVLKK